jgi:hypothetical protein
LAVNALARIHIRSRGYQDSGNESYPEPSLSKRRHVQVKLRLDHKLCELYDNSTIAESSENRRWTRRPVESTQDLSDMPGLRIGSFSLIGTEYHLLARK